MMTMIMEILVPNMKLGVRSLMKTENLIMRLMLEFSMKIGLKFKPKS